MMVKSADSKGGKQAKESITISFRASAVGEKLKPLMIWKLKTQRCFKGKVISKLGIHWKSNRKAWMTAATFEEWLTDFDQKMAKEGRNILLTLENTTCHKHQTV
ncbi:hypothetical protein AVEN_247725-1 [Araneus ventricosus]|uniref:DDE-1 domain-containing protein n=1 Tax=Araneus ventricosus TaxID=182803 RepID=A0A4Y2PE97_ARAVE|nr:hypothetical protein AVEN_247725-1 [Araneus ventricosus]